MIYLKNVSTLKFKAENCTGCRKCIEVCPRQVFEENGKKVRIIDTDRCMECGACMMNCAFDALEVDKGVGCAAAIIIGALRGTEPSCDCGPSSGGNSGCCC